MNILVYGFGSLETLDIPLVTIPKLEFMVQTLLNLSSVSDTIRKGTLSSEGEIQILTAQQW